MRVLLIAGGWSNEREVSLSGAAKIHEALLRLGCKVTRLDPAERFDDILELASDSDFAFINMHGTPGEDGLVQAMLEQVDCPYQGSGPQASFLALNKACAKQVFARAGIPTPRWEYLPRRPQAGWSTKLRFPLFVKPNMGGSSLDLCRADNAEELAPAIERIFSRGETVLLEEGVNGQEVTSAILGDKALPLILIQPAGCAFFDYRCKYTQGGAKEICPAPIPERTTRRVQELSMRAHKAMKLRGYSRSDFMLEGDEPYILEVNTLPGMTPTSLVPQAAHEAGLDFDALIKRLMDLGLEAHGRKSGI